MASKDSTPVVLDTITARKTLWPRRDPYFVALGGAQGVSLGFRKLGGIGTDDGTWIVRRRGDGADGTKGYSCQSLGKQADFNAASKAANAWATQKDAGVTDTEMTVREVCAEYAKAVETTRV